MSGTAEDFVELVNRGEDSSKFSMDVERSWFSVIDNHPECRVSVAQNTNICIYVLEVLARDYSSSVRAAVAKREECNKYIFGILKDDPSEKVKTAVLNNKTYVRLKTSNAY